MFLAGKAEAKEDAASVRFAFLDSLADLDFLLACEEGDFAHLAEVHLDGVVKDVEAAFVFFLRFGLGFGAFEVWGFNNFDLEAAQFGVNGVEEFGCDKLVGQSVVDVVVSEVALFLCQTEEVLDLLSDDGRIDSHGQMGDGDNGGRRLRRMQGSLSGGRAVFWGRSLGAGWGLKGKARFFGALFQPRSDIGRHFSTVPPVNSVFQHINSDTFVTLRFIQTYAVSRQF